MSFKQLEYKHFCWLKTISKYNSFDEIHNAMKKIREYKMQNNKTLWINNTNLSRNNYWILTDLLNKYSYNNVLNALNQIFTK